MRTLHRVHHHRNPNKQQQQQQQPHPEILIQIQIMENHHRPPSLSEMSRRIRIKEKHHVMAIIRVPKHHTMNPILRIILRWRCQNRTLTPPPPPPPTTIMIIVNVKVAWMDVMLVQISMTWKQRRIKHNPIRSVAVHIYGTVFIFRFNDDFTVFLFFSSGFSVRR